jgi:rRNA processing protein Krr1/Pno1
VRKTLTGQTVAVVGVLIGIELARRVVGNVLSSSVS